MVFLMLVVSLFCLWDWWMQVIWKTAVQLQTWTPMLWLDYLPKLLFCGSQPLRLKLLLLKSSHWMFRLFKGRLIHNNLLRVHDLLSEETCTLFRFPFRENLVKEPQFISYSYKRGSLRQWDCNCWTTLNIFIFLFSRWIDYFCHSDLAKLTFEHNNQIVEHIYSSHKQRTLFSLGLSITGGQN